VVGTGLRARDWVLPLGLAALVVLELLALEADGRVGAGVVLLVGCAALLGRRRYPVAAGIAAGVCCAGMPWMGPAIDEVATPILLIAVASYSMARWVRGYAGLLGLAVILAMLIFDYATIDLRAHDVTDVVFLLALLGPPYVFGRITRQMADYNELLEREQELVHQAAVRDERDRIARELHDVIAHSVSAMVVQASVAQDLIERDPARARVVLESAAGTGRRALAEAGRLLHVIRDSADELGLAPVRGLADVPSLVEEHRRRGLRVELDSDVLDADLPAAVDVSGYRIVGEALTNAERYAADGTVELEVRVSGDDLVVRASNASSGRTGAGSGLGLVGMAERVALLGGAMSTVTTDGRFVLEVRLPVRTGVQEPA
jgi:signal transduction histidine kinase